MLWSITKIAIFLALCVGLALGAWQIMEMEGGVTIQFQGIELYLTPIKVVLALGVLIVALWLFLKLLSLLVAVLKFINGDDTALSRYFDRSRERKGFEALSQGMLALAAGEGRLALAKASKAEKYLHKPELTNLLTAQAAEMCGDRKTAETVYKRLLKDDSTRFVGVRGLLKHKLEDGDTDTARQLAEKALGLKPKHAETQDVLLRLQAEAEDWAGARKTLGTKLKYGSLPRDVHKRRDAVMALSEAKCILDDKNDIAAREAAIEANRKSPDLIPAAYFAARAYIEKGEKRSAARVLKKAWDAQPHPDLAAAFAEIEPSETPAARIKRFQKLIKTTPEHRESRLLMAELNIAAEDFPAARRALGPLAEKEPDARSLTIMAAIERGEGSSDTVVKAWLTRALGAPRGPAWVCDNCQNIHTEWVPICKNCHSFDTLSWRSPPDAAVKAATGVEMLPLIVGAIGDASSTPAPEDAATAEVIADAEIAASDVTPDTQSAADSGNRQG